MEGLFQPTHLIVILIIALLIFGPSKLPELGKGLGEAIKGFKSGLRDTEPAKAGEIIPPTGVQPAPPSSADSALAGVNKP